MSTCGVYAVTIAATNQLIKTNIFIMQCGILACGFTMTSLEHPSSTLQTALTGEAAERIDFRMASSGCTWLLLKPFTYVRISIAS